MYYMQWNYDKTYIAKSYKFAERSMIRNRLFTFRDDLFARTLSRVFQFTINHIHTHTKVQSKYQRNNFYSWFAFSWVWEIWSDFNAIVKIEINETISSEKFPFYNPTTMKWILIVSSIPFNLWKVLVIFWKTKNEYIESKSIKHSIN